jgi:hypothetical protein
MCSKHSWRITGAIAFGLLMLAGEIIALANHCPNFALEISFRLIGMYGCQRQADLRPEMARPTQAQIRLNESKDPGSMRLFLEPLVNPGVATDERPACEHAFANVARSNQASLHLSNSKNPVCLPLTPRFRSMHVAALGEDVRDLLTRVWIEHLRARENSVLVPAASRQHFSVR